MVGAEGIEPPISPNHMKTQLSCGQDSNLPLSHIHEIPDAPIIL